MVRKSASEVGVPSRRDTMKADLCGLDGDGLQGETEHGLTDVEPVSCPCPSS